jgi:hypothetical protein
VIEEPIARLTPCSQTGVGLCARLRRRGDAAGEQLRLHPAWRLVVCELPEEDSDSVRGLQPPDATNTRALRAPAGDHSPVVNGEEQPVNWMARHTVPLNVTSSCPVLRAPAGVAQSDIPVAMQIVRRPQCPFMSSPSVSSSGRNATQGLEVRGLDRGSVRAAAVPPARSRAARDAPLDGISPVSGHDARCHTRSPSG